MFCLDIFDQVVGFYLKNYFSPPHGLRVNSPFGLRPHSIDSEPIRARGIIVKYYRRISYINCCYFKLILFFCDLNFLCEYSISRGFIFAIILQSLKTRNKRPARLSTNTSTFSSSPGARFLGPRPRTVPCFVYIQGRRVNSEREAIELRIQADLVVLECPRFGK